MIASRSLVLFDIDGTLMRGVGGHHKNALIEGIKNVTGLPTHLDGVSTSGMLDRDLIAIMLRSGGQSDRRIRIVLRRVMEECQNAFAANCAIDLNPFLCAGVRETLGRLDRNGAVMGLVTGNLSRIGWQKMELDGLRTYFSVGAFAEDGTTRARLARIAANRAIKQRLVQKNCRISLIGDHPNDVRAAKANGFQAIAVGTGLTPMEELRASEPDVLVRDLNELDLQKLL
ncbi:MAG: HAD hydrolase-like protein [Acidobacteriaceae bacterium]|nr:HAD hydrolase-like protein [Acidobacteriaceae bacterium]